MGKSLTNKTVLGLMYGGLVGSLLVLAPNARAELWKCTPKAAGAIPYYTETPSFGDDVACSELSNLNFSKPGSGNAEKKGKKKKKEKDPLKKAKKKAAKKP